MENLRIAALALHLGVEIEDVNISSYNDNVVEYGNQEYLVVTDDEADELWDQDLENYIDECILPDLDDRYKNYFDRESWKSDARYDGRAHSLNRYDGREDTITVYEYEYNGTDEDRENVYHDNANEYAETDEYITSGEGTEFYIYRQN